MRFFVLLFVVVFSGCEPSNSESRDKYYNKLKDQFYPLACQSRGVVELNCYGTSKCNIELWNAYVKGCLEGKKILEDFSK